MIDANQRAAFRQQFLDLHVYDQAQVFTSLTSKQRQQVYAYLAPEELGDTFDGMEIDLDVVKNYLAEMTPQYAAAVLNAMYTDNEVDLLEHVDQTTLSTYLNLLPAKSAQEVRRLLHYEDRTAGAIMATEFVAIVANQTVRSALNVLRSQAIAAETIYYVYVKDDAERLVGVVSLRDLIVNDEDTMISAIYNHRVYSVQVTDDQEAVAQAIRDYNFLAMPVTDQNDHLLGIITVDDIIDVIDEESAEDYSGLAGVNIEELSENPVKASLRRLPWLITLLFLGMSTASLISHYEALVSEASILAVFISLITGTAGNAGTQSLAVAVRRLAIQDNQRGMWRLIVSEVTTGLIIGLITGATITVIVGIWKGTFILGLVIGLAMLCAITVANLAGSLIPILMDKIGVDPAVASGPFISTLSDLTSVLIYFSIAQVFIRYFIS